MPCQNGSRVGLPPRTGSPRHKICLCSLTGEQARQQFCPACPRLAKTGAGWGCHLLPAAPATKSACAHSQESERANNSAQPAPAWPKQEPGGAAASYRQPPPQNLPVLAHGRASAPTYLPSQPPPGQNGSRVGLPPRPRSPRHKICLCSLKGEHARQQFCPACPRLAKTGAGWGCRLVPAAPPQKLPVLAHGRASAPTILPSLPPPGQNGSRVGLPPRTGSPRHKICLCSLTGERARQHICPASPRLAKTGAGWGCRLVPAAPATKSACARSRESERANNSAQPAPAWPKREPGGAATSYRQPPPQKLPVLAHGRASAPTILPSLPPPWPKREPGGAAATKSACARSRESERANNSAQPAPAWPKREPGGAAASYRQPPPQNLPVLAHGRASAPTILSSQHPPGQNGSRVGLLVLTHRRARKKIRAAPVWPGRKPGGAASQQTPPQKPPVLAHGQARKKSAQPPPGKDRSRVGPCPSRPRHKNRRCSLKGKLAKKSVQPPSSQDGSLVGPCPSRPSHKKRCARSQASPYTNQ